MENPGCPAVVVSRKRQNAAMKNNLMTVKIDTPALHFTRSAGVLFVIFEVRLCRSMRSRHFPQTGKSKCRRICRKYAKWFF
ncbi:MAG TPA: hypothetical protein ENJ88_03645 [Phaeodactylibacter sp.]|nr:hypothetical protein [Phaeodactylibacter sp.]